jgi:hypothetical protein
MSILQPHHYTCRECGETKILFLRLQDLQRWKSGEVIQRVFPDLSQSDRELMMSGICGECFDDFFEQEKESGSWRRKA